MSFKPCPNPHTAKEAIILLCSVSVFSSSPGHHCSLSISRHTSKPFVLFHHERANSYFIAHINSHDSPSLVCRFMCPSVLNAIVFSFALNDSYNLRVLLCNLEFPLDEIKYVQNKLHAEHQKLSSSLLSSFLANLFFFLLTNTDCTCW